MFQKIPLESIDPSLKNWWLADEVKKLGFPQKRQFQAMYYIRPDMLICIDDLSALKRDGKTDFEDIFNQLIFKPRLEDIIEESPWLQETIRLNDGSICTYSNIEEDPEIIEKTGRKDKALRARGANHWEAYMNLYIAVKQKEQKDNPSRTRVLGSEGNTVEIAVDPATPKPPADEDMPYEEIHENLKAKEQS